MARPSPLADPDFAQQVAQAFVDGTTVKQMMDIFGVGSHHTIAAWRRDPRVKRISLKLTEDRILRITRRIDSKIEAILEEADELDVKDLVLLRKEFLGGALRAQTEKADEQTIGEAMDWVEANPDLAKLLADSMETTK